MAYTTHAEVLHALADGKTIVTHGLRYRLAEGQGLERLHTSNPLGLWQREAYFNLTYPPSHYSEYVEPNPHAIGTYQWAREEYARGRDVQLGSNVYVAAEDAWDTYPFTDVDFRATTWGLA